MKSFVRFSKWEELYLCKKASDRETSILGLLLATDVGFRTDNFFTAWLDDPTLTGVSSNATMVDLEEGDIIEIRDMLDDETGPVFRIPKDQYLKMMGLWKFLCKVKPKEITVTWDGKEITVEGRN